MGFVREPFQTKVIDLTQAASEFEAKISKNTLYKARRARRDGVVCGFDGDADGFRHFYNDIARLQMRAPIPAGLLKSALTKSYIAYATLDDQKLVMHCYLADREQRRVRLWYSASRYVVEDSSDIRNAVGRANRLLHLECLHHFKAEGFECYDFGGYSDDANDKKKMAINRFKDGFGGELRAESNYFSYPLFLTLRLKALVSGLRNRESRANEAVAA